MRRALLSLAFLGACRAPAPTGADLAPDAADLARASGQPDATQPAATDAGDDAIPERIRRLRDERVSPHCPPGMAYVPAASFTMGSIANEPELVVTHPAWEIVAPSMLPAHAVRAPASCVDLAPVTVVEYDVCVQRGACSPPSHLDPRRGGGACNSVRPGHGEYPVDCVDWRQAGTYCAWMGRRLPTEIEWEHAARGEDERCRTYGDGRAVPKTCNPPDRDELSCPVASFPDARGPFGLFDMTDAAGEWTASRYCAYPKQECQSGTIAVRGGGPISLTTERESVAPTEQQRDLTFRCAANPLSK